MYSPNSEIILLNTPLTADGEHQLKFSSKSEQSSYFLGCSPLYFENCTYQRKDGFIRVNANIDTLFQYNYIMYKNIQFSNKYFYAYIVRLEYVNEQTTYIYIKTDVYQTWQFDLTFNKSFIDRQHVSADEYNTINDTVAHGQLIESKMVLRLFTGGYFVFCTSDITQDVTTDSTPYTFMIGDYNVPCWVLYWSEAEANMMSQVLQRITNNGWGDRILTAVYVPFVGNDDGMIVTDIVSDKIGTIHVCQGFEHSEDMTGNITFDFSKTMEYKKAMTYPYAKIVITDATTGQTVELSPEKFTDIPSASFEIQCSVSETPVYKIIPKNYQSQDLAFSDSLVTKCSTSLPIANNLYAKYMMMNGEINNNNKMFAGINAVNSGMNGSPMGVVGNLENIINITAQESQATKLGNQVSAIVDGAMERLNFYNGIKISLFTMDSYHMEMANNFWKMYGYPVHSMSEPILNSGGDFNYIKMVSPNIVGGNVPQEDMIEIENIFSKGVTLWHTTSGYKKY